MSKGKPKPSLRDLSREYPATEEFKELREYLFTNAPDLEAAISSSASVEMDLEHLILYRLKVTDAQTIKELTEEGAPLCTFHDKIELGLVLRLYSSEVAHNLHIIRRVRNCFAHSIRLTKFDHPLIDAEIKKFRRFRPMGKPIRPIFRLVFDKKPPKDAKTRFIVLCIACNYFLMRRTHVSMTANRRARERRKLKKTAPLTGSQLLSQAIGLINRPMTQTGGPSHGEPTNILSGYLRPRGKTILESGGD